MMDEEKLEMTIERIMSIPHRISCFIRRFTDRKYQWFYLFNDAYRDSLKSGKSYDEFVSSYTSDVLMPQIRKMREKKRKTIVSLLSQEDFIKENFGVKNYTKTYHKELLRRWKAHLENNKSCHLS